MPATKASKKTTKTAGKTRRVPANKITVVEKMLQVDAAVARRKPSILFAGEYKGIVSIPGWASGESGNNGPSALYSTSPWAKACIDMRANALAQIEWGIFDADYEELEEHPLIDLIKCLDNEGVRATVCDLMIHGQAFWQKVYARGGGGLPLRLKRLNAGTMTVVAGSDGVDGFTQQLEGVTQTEFERDEIVFFHDFDPDNDLGGLSPADVARAAIEIENYADRYLTSFFRNRAVPDVTYETEQELGDGDYARIQRNLKKFKGVDNQHKSQLLEKGMKVNVISFPLTDLALETVRLEARRSLCAVLGVPMSLIGADPSANFATADAERKSLYTEHVLPQAEYLASVINAELVVDFDENLEFAWKGNELPIMQPDAVSEANRLAVLVEKGIITPLCAALELGFSEDDVPEKKEPAVPGAAPQPGVTPPALAPFAAATQEVGQAEVDEPAQKNADMKRWMRKALAKVKAGKSPVFDFESAAIPNALKAAILGQLETCETADEVRRVFNQDTGQAPGMLTTGQFADLQRQFIDTAKALKQEPVTVHVPITNVLPEQKAAVVNVEGTTVNVEPTPVEVKAIMPEQSAPVVNVTVEKEPKLVGRTETQRVHRDAMGNIDVTESEAEYHHEGE